jgi:preprotein translocase subunit SecA
MLNKIMQLVFGSRNKRLLKEFDKIVKQINGYEASLSALSNEALQAKTPAFKERLALGESVENLLPEAFAVCREASKRIFGMRHFDVQLIGGMVLNQGKIAEMRTGEGKTLMATLPVYLNALTGKGVHVVTMNEYLVQRDAEWMRPLYEFLGLTVGVIKSFQDPTEKKAAYACDIVYGTNNEFGFDYLRDNMVFRLEDKAQRPLHFAIVDEVDSILIDEARTPLIISGPAEDSSALYQEIDKIIPKLTAKQAEDDETGDYEVDEKTKQAHLSEKGHEKLEDLLEKAGLFKDSKNLYDLSNISLMHHVNASLRAHTCFKRDVEYIVKNNEVIIVDEHTGRTMPGRRWSDGLHQAIEAKEGVKIQNENMTMASITFQNYFRLYEKLSGMTGTADTEAYEFQQIYGLEVVVIPTNRPMIRQDFPDQIYLTATEKFHAVIEDIKASHKKGQPVLVGTASIEASEYLSHLLTKEKIAHQVLNAKFHEKEAEIIAQAGQPFAVTIATNMAGRGTDIVLGGNVDALIASMPEPTPEKIAALKEGFAKEQAKVREAGGLHIIGSERHESRRIDNQLRGRAGRQGDPGSSRFYLSLEDPLMRIFASDKMAGLMKRLGMKEGESIEHPWISKAVENAQRKVEGHHFDIRKQLLEYDDVASEQRRVIYSERDDLLGTSDLSATIKDMQKSVLTTLFRSHIPEDSFEEQWDIKNLEQSLKEEFNVALPLGQWLSQEESLTDAQLFERIETSFNAAYTEKETKVGAAVMREFEKSMMLQNVDTHWREHLSAMDRLRQGIGWRGYAQKNPKQEYKKESFTLFRDMLDKIKYQVVSILSRAEFVAKEEVEALEAAQAKKLEQLQFQHEGNSQAETSAEGPKQALSKKIGRNDPCDCGSGKKYKNCHGKL